MINIFAPINLLGYGIHAQNIIKALMDKDIDICLSKIGQPQVDPFFESYWQTAEKRLPEFDAKSPSIFIFHDEYSHQACGSPLMTFSVFETTRPKDLSIKMLNNGPTDIVLTTTQAHKDILAEYIKKPIEVVNEGIDPCIYNTIPYDPHIDTGKFTYITVGKKEKRKNTTLILKSFIETMEDKEVALIAHTFNMFANTVDDHPFKNLLCWSDINPIDHGFEYKGFDGKAHKFVKDKCDIYFTVPGIATVEMPSLYHSANVGIQVSRSEGWDLPATELMACGVPVIASNCLGHSEYLPNAPMPQKDLIIDPKGSEKAIDNIWFNGDQGEWSVIDEEDIKDKLDYIYNNQNLYEEKSEDLANYMEENYSWEKAADKIINLTKNA